MSAPADLLAVRPRSHRSQRRLARELAGAVARVPLPSLGVARVRSGARHCGGTAPSGTLALRALGLASDDPISPVERHPKHLSTLAPRGATSVSPLALPSLGTDPAQPLLGVACAELLGAFVPAPRLLGVGLDAADAKLCELCSVEGARQRHGALG